MKIYLETPQDVEIPMPLGYTGTPTAQVFLNDVAVGSVVNPTIVDDHVVVRIPYAATKVEADGRIEVNFTIDATQEKKIVPFSVETPYVSYAEAKKIINEELTLEDYKEIETSVRYIIHAHTGQTFGKRTKQEVVVGTGEAALALNERLISLTGIKTLTGVLNPSAAIVIADGWYLKKRYTDVLSEIENDSVYWYGQGFYEPEDFPEEAPHGLGHTPDRFGHGVIISAPGRAQGPIWKDDYPFTITGTWGYEQVPTAVREAAKLLMNDYACSEQIYRDRYLESVKSADWRIQFNEQAYMHTGNVRADQLLNDYIMKLGWAVI